MTDFRFPALHVLGTHIYRNTARKTCGQTNILLQKISRQTCKANFSLWQNRHAIVNQLGQCDFGCFLLFVSCMSTVETLVNRWWSPARRKLKKKLGSGFLLTTLWRDELYRVYIKYSDKLQEWVIHVTRKEQFHINTCPGVAGFFSLSERLHSTTNALTIHNIIYN
jgi:hypothetical protein